MSSHPLLTKSIEQKTLETLERIEILLRNLTNYFLLVDPPPPVEEHKPGCQSGDFGPCDCEDEAPAHNDGPKTPKTPKASKRTPWVTLSTR